jgi:hypothetical protein
MRVENIRSKFVRQGIDASCGRCHLARRDRPARHWTAGGIERRPMESPTFGILHVAASDAVPRRCQLKRFPPERALLAQDRDRAERIAAVQRQR